MQAGSHKVLATGEVQWGRSSTGSEQVAVECQVQGGPCAGELLWWVGNFASAESSRITVDGLRALGARLAEGDILDLDGLGSKAASVRAKEETYQGETRWKFSISGGFGFKEALDRGGLEALRKRMRGQLLHGAQKSGAAAPRREAKVHQDQDDDISF
jgi:hypothetical protein